MTGPSLTQSVVGLENRNLLIIRKGQPLILPNRTVLCPLRFDCLTKFRVFFPRNGFRFGKYVIDFATLNINTSFGFCNYQIKMRITRRFVFNSNLEREKERETFHWNEQTYHLTKRNSELFSQLLQSASLASPFWKTYPRRHLKAIQGRRNDFISNLAEWICNEQWVGLLPIPLTYN